MKKRFSIMLVMLCLVLLISTLQLNNQTVYGNTETSDGYDIVIKSGTVINPETEHILEGYNVGIKGGEISRITKSEITGSKEIDATGLVVSPGFIDLVSYEPNPVGIDLKIQDGVTSNLLMHGGTEDARKWYANLKQRGLPVNYGASTFITRTRWSLVGSNIDAKMTSEEDIQKQVEIARKNIEEGALGVSFSFEYTPGILDKEVIPLLKLAKEVNAPTFYHLRYSDEEKGLEGIQEVLDYAKETSAAIHIMHINSTGGTFKMDKALQMVQDAVDQGLDITTDVYPYDGWATYLHSARFREGWQDRFKITYKDLQIAGTDERLTEETFKKYRAMSYVLAYAHGSMPEEELRMALQDPNVMISTDTITTPSLNNHPRGAGTYGRLFGKYVREEKVISLMDAIKKATLQPAQRLESIAPSMKRKGRVEVGADADLTLFNPDIIIDQATVKDPGIPTKGIEYVIVNGVVIKDTDGLVRNVNPGQPIQSYFVDQPVEEMALSYEMEVNGESTGTVDNIVIKDDLTYVPLNPVLQHMKLEYSIKEDGSTSLGNIGHFQVGENTFHRDNDVTLDQEPIIYKGQVYVYENDLIRALEGSYEMTVADGKMSVTALNIAPEDNGNNGEENNEPPTNDQETGAIKNEENQNSMTWIVLSIFAVLLLVFAVIMLLRIRRKE